MAGQPAAAGSGIAVRHLRRKKDDGRGRVMAAAAAPAAQPGLAPVLKILPFINIAILGLGALAFALVHYADRERSGAYASTLPRREEEILAAGHGVLGVLLLASSIIVENALVIRLTARGEGMAPVSVSILVAYLGFSSLALAHAAWRSRPAPVLGRYHPFLSALAAGALLLLALLAPAAVKKTLIPFALVALTGISAVLALRQNRGMRPLEGKGVQPGGPVGGGTRPGGEHGATLQAPPGFPPGLLSRFSDPVAIGSGGVSRVFRATRRDTGQVVAVKVPLAMDEATGRAFLREMQGWEALGHENIARVLGANILPIPYVEMEFYPRSLADLEKPLDPRAAARIMAGISRGLAFAHGRGIVHRDLKPGNILLDDALSPKIGDWGLAKFTGAASMTGGPGFSPRYAAPEQLDPGRFGNPDGRTDIYGAGCIFYELVTGRPPFGGESIAEVTGRILSSVPVPPSALNPAAAPVEAIILRCLEREPARRYQSAGELERDLHGYLGDGQQGS